MKYSIHIQHGQTYSFLRDNHYPEILEITFPVPMLISFPSLAILLQLGLQVQHRILARKTCSLILSTTLVRMLLVFHHLVCDIFLTPFNEGGETYFYVQSCILKRSLRPQHTEQVRRKQEYITGLQTSISYEYRCKNPQQNTRRPNTAAYLKVYTPQPSGIYPWNTRVVQHRLNKLINHINRIEKKNKTTQSSQLMQKKHLTKSNTLK